MPDVPAPQIPPTLKVLLANARAAAGDIPLEDFTCYDCLMWRSCRYAFDAYNTQGDCLAEK